MDLEVLTSIFSNIQSPDNAIRKAAEEQLKELASNDPSNAVLTLLTVATTTNTQVPTDIRQASLLFLKKIIPLYWSAGFGSFSGTAISQEVKAEVRAGLLAIIYNNNGNQKILNSVVYTIVQIAAVDYPDEWPDLLQFIYSHLLNETASKDQIIGGLVLLQDLFDDILIDDLFFQKDAGVTTVTLCWEKIADPTADPEIRKHAALLYKICLLQLQNSELIEQRMLSEMLKLHLTTVSKSILDILNETKLTVHDIEFKTYLIQISNTIIEEFPEDHVLLHFPEQIKRKTIEDLQNLVEYYYAVIINDQKDVYITSVPYVVTAQAVANLIIEQYQLLASIKSPIEQSQLISFIQSTLKYSLMPNFYVERYTEDFNVFVTDELGVSSDYTVRHAIQDFIIDASHEDFTRITEWSFDEFLKYGLELDWKSLETLLFLMNSSFKNDEATLKFTNDKVLQVLKKMETIIFDPTTSLYVKARAILTLPSFFESFREIVNSSQFAIALYEKILLENQWSQNQLAASILIMIIRSTSFVRFPDIQPESRRYDWRLSIDKLTFQIMEDADEDTPPLLVEAITVALKLNALNSTEMKTLIKISSMDPSNIQLAIDVQEYLEALLDICKESSEDLFRQYFEEALQSAFVTIQSSAGEFSSLLGIYLEMLNTFVNSSPFDRSDGQFDKLVNVISNLILVSEDNQILQLASELYNSMITKLYDGYFDLEIVLQVLNKLLNPELSDSAVLKVGSLVVSVLTRFGQKLQGTEYFSLILQATTNRLLKTEHVSAIENFLNVLCFMVQLDPEQSLLFLKSFDLLQAALNFWFKNFDILNGENIEINCKAIMKIYLFSDESLWDVQVDGDEQVDFGSDIIVTRSMRKQQKFQQVPVPLMIIKILVNELYQQTDDNIVQDDNEEDDNHSHGEDDMQDDDGWEDVEDVEFDKLQKYVNEEGPSTNRDDSNPELKTLLIRFFKEIASKNVLNFKEIYDNLLSDGQRTVLTNNIV